MNGYIDDEVLVRKALEEAKEAAKLLHMIATEQLQGASMLKESAHLSAKLYNSIEVIEI
jgi:hypothetical protein